MWKFHSDVFQSCPHLNEQHFAQKVMPEEVVLRVTQNRGKMISKEKLVLKLIPKLYSTVESSVIIYIKED